MNQQEHDQRTLAWHRYLVSQAKSNPTLLEQARATLVRWQAVGRGPNRDYLAQWQKALDSGIEAVEQLATEASEQGCALRQCSPLSSVLPDTERWAFRRQWRKENATSKS